MFRFYSTMTVEEAISHYPIDHNEVEVYNHLEEFVGYLTLESLSVAIHQGELIRPIIDFVLLQAPVQSFAHHSIPDSDFHTFFTSELCHIAFNSLYDGVYITDGSGVTLFVNEAYQRITGIKDEEVIGQHMSHLVERGIISASASLETILKKKPVTVIQTIRNGRQTIVSATPIMSSSNEIMYVVSSVRDITELIKLKHELDKQKLMFQRLPQTMPALEHSSFHNLVIGPSTTSLFQLADKVAKSDAKILLQGETGVGKSMIAKYIHTRSNRSNEIFMELNCSAIPNHLVESELFGYEPGSFTGALKQGKIGILEKSHGGTLFLDEIGDLPLELQVKLLKVVEENRFMRVGSTEMRQVDVRIISATHRDLAEIVRKGEFREDLYYRLNIVTLNVPPLRERKEEIISLLEVYLKQFNDKYHENKKMTPECYEWLTNYSWPGNIRELANLVERLVVTTFHDEIDVSDLPSFIQPVFPNKEPVTLKETVAQVEKSLISKAMQKYGTTRVAAEALGISQSSIVQKMKKYQL
ncbi:PAS domain S-box protein [Cytobacillus depressus]|uniref:HTH-type transcriptional regulatory protein TyrR n=1 Tax=Cytobacillus depressus TaxID=1602942 RepID=A0A6L3VBX4_9BACI|nr:sigma 54-interacting transcriptional regulator [Cytobacillus depressus]KAB2336713.1 PAS domain S-box protein [Cytobacillus depressus]